MSPKKEKPYRLSSKDDIREKVGPIKWFKNYWYFYKMPVIIVTLVLVIAVIMIVDLSTREKEDFLLVAIDQYAMPEEEYEELFERIRALLADANGDGKLVANEIHILVPEVPTDEYAIAAYDQLTMTLLNDKVVFYIVDTYLHDNLVNTGSLEPLSTFGLTGDTDYGVKITGTSLLEGLTRFQSLKYDYFLVFKITSYTVKNQREYDLARQTVVDMIRNIQGKK